MWTSLSLGDGAPNPERYGFSWRIRRVNDRQMIEHRGVVRKHIGAALFVGIRFIEPAPFGNRKQEPGAMNRAPTSLSRFCDLEDDVDDSALCVYEAPMRKNVS